MCQLFKSLEFKIMDSIVEKISCIKVIMDRIELLNSLGFRIWGFRFKSIV